MSHDGCPLHAIYTQQQRTQCPSINVSCTKDHFQPRRCGVVVTSKGLYIYIPLFQYMSAEARKTDRGRQGRRDGDQVARRTRPHAVHRTPTTPQSTAQNTPSGRTPTPLPSAHDQRVRGGSARGRYPRPLCPYHARNETWWQVPVLRDLFVTVTVTVNFCHNRALSPLECCTHAPPTACCCRSPARGRHIVRRHLVLVAQARSLARPHGARPHGG